MTCYATVMHPLVRGAAAVAVFSALGSLAPIPEPPAPIVEPPRRAGVAGMPAPCGPGTLPEGPVCVRIPTGATGATGAGTAAAAAPGRPREPEPERVPRRPDRPADPAAYRYPLADARVLGGFADVPSPPSPWPMGEGIEIGATKGAEVKLVALDHQEGAAEVVFAGELYGPTIALLQTVKEGDQSKRYLAIYGYLDHVANGLAAGAKLEDGAILGAAGDAGVGTLGHVYLETRLARGDAKIEAMDTKKLGDATISAPCDPRNVLPLK